jgi:hypothetical protein
MPKGFYSFGMLHNIVWQLVTSFSPNLSLMLPLAAAVFLSFSSVSWWHLDTLAT